MAREALKYSYDEGNDVIEIEGVRYAGAVFRQLGGKSFLNVGDLYRLMNRLDGVVTIEVIKGVE